MRRRITEVRKEGSLKRRGGREGEGGGGGGGERVNEEEVSYLKEVEVMKGGVTGDLARLSNLSVRRLREVHQ